MLRRLLFSADTHASPDPSLEWLVTNGLGGYASGSVGGALTRRYHGLLIAALPAPLGRVVMLHQLRASVRLGNREIQLDVDPAAVPAAPGVLTEFRLEDGLPVWCYDIEGRRLERRVILPHLQNTVHVVYRLLDGDEGLRLSLRPLVHFRPHEVSLSDTLPDSYSFTAFEDRYEIAADGQFPPLRLLVHGTDSAFTVDRVRIASVVYEAERRRGYPHIGALWSPGFASIQLHKMEAAGIAASTERWETVRALTPDQALAAEHVRRSRFISSAGELDPVAAELALAADQFVITPAGRIEEEARAHAAGDEARTVIAGYHWFTDWGRDTMISLEGLTLHTGRQREAGYILRTFAHYVRDGLIPNLFPEGQRQGLYHTADATLWFFHALDRYLRASRDRATLRLLLPTLIQIAEYHVHGTRFGIGMDPADGLLKQGAEGYQLTWMDAKVDDWVVTPRRGKAVEINALWYAALCHLAQWVEEERGALTAAPYREYAARARESFNRRFWNPATHHLFDVIDGPNGHDPACRPNQIFAISLPHPVLEREHWGPVVETVRERLLTPVGLRTLAPDHPDYKPCYDGDLRARDAAYHQGTVWAWLIGPYIDAWRRVHPDDPEGAHAQLQGFPRHLDEACVGSVSEIFDAEPPFTPRGCISQAWSVAELLRVWIQTRPESTTGKL